MATDDVHDLFDTEEGEESDDPAEESTEGFHDERFDGPEEAARDGFATSEDGESEPSGDDGSGSTSTFSLGADADDADESESAEDVQDLFGRGSAEGSTADSDGDETAGSRDSTGDDDVFGEFGSSGSTAADDEEAGDEFAGFEPPSTESDRPDGDDLDGSERTAASSTSRDRSIRDDPDEFASSDSTEHDSSTGAPGEVQAPDSGSIDSSTSSSSPGEPEGSDTSDPASERSSASSGDDGDGAESSGASIFSGGSDADGGTDVAAGGDPPDSVPDDPSVAEETSPPAEESTKEETETAETAGVVGTAPAGGTTDDDPDPIASAEASADATDSIGGGGFVTASPTESDEPAVDEEAASEALSESGRLSTGVDVLDEAMGGGVPPGRLVLLVADPGVQSELIVDSLLTQRDTLFVTTDRPDWEVQKDIEPGIGSGEIEIRDRSPDSLLSGVDSLLDEIGTTSNFVLDSVNELELVSRGRYRIFLSDVKRRLFETGSIGLLTGVTVDHESARDLTLRRADIVWRIETRTAGGELEHWFSLPKFRGGAAMTETVKLQLTDEVRVDPAWREE